MCKSSVIVVFAATAILGQTIPSAAAWSNDPTINLPVKVGDGSQQVSASSSVSDGAGGALVFWVDEPYSTPQVWGQRVSADGEILWAVEGIPMCTASGSKSLLHAISDGSGGAIVVWRDRRGSDYDFYGQRIDSNGNILWPAGAPSLDAQPLVTVAGEQDSLSAISDGAGGVIISWRHDDPTDDAAYAQRIDPNGNRMWPSGAPADTGTVVCDHSHAQFNPSSTPDGSGGVIVVWTDSRNSATTLSDIYAQRLDADGNRQWALDGMPVTLADYGQTEPLATATGTGGAIVIWKDYRVSGAVEGIFAQRISAAGVPMWAEDVTLSEELEGGKGIVSDGAGGAYVVWRDRRFISTTDRDLLAQRLSPIGHQMWGVDDLPLVVEDDSQSGFDILSDGPGGLYVAWADQRDGGVDIYAQHISTGGAISGPVNGFEVCTHPDWQAGPTIVGGGFGLIVAWNDYRTAGNGTDVYANKVFVDQIFNDGFESGDPSEWDAVFP